MNKKTISIALLLLIITMTACTSTQQLEQKEQIETKTKEKVVIAEFAEILFYAPLYIADDKGFFEDEGLEVTIVNAGGLDKTYAALLSGDAQYGVADPMITAITGEKGKPGIVIAQIVRGVPMWGVTNKNITINKPIDFKGLKVGTTPAPSTAHTLQKKLLSDYKVEATILEFASGTCLAAMNQGRVDICIEFEPGTSIALEKGSQIAYSGSNYFPDFALTGLFVLPEHLKDNPEQAQKVVSAMQKATEYIFENKEGTINTLQKRFPNTERKTIETAVDRLLKTEVWSKNITVEKSGWDVAAKIRLELGHVKEHPEYSRYVNKEYSERAIAD